MRSDSIEPTALRADRRHSLATLQRIHHELRRAATTGPSPVDHLQKLIQRRERRDALISWTTSVRRHTGVDAGLLTGDLVESLRKLGPRTESTRAELQRQFLASVEALAEEGTPLPDRDLHLRFILEAGLSVFYLVYDPGRRRANYYLVLNDLIDDRFAASMRTDRIPLGRGTFSHAMGYFERCARSSRAFQRHPFAMSLPSTLVDLCGRVSVRDRVAGKRSVCLVPVMGDESSRIVGILYFGHPIQGLFYDEDAGRQLPFVDSTLVDIVARHRRDLVSSLERDQWEQHYGVSQRRVELDVQPGELQELRESVLQSLIPDDGQDGAAFAIAIFLHQTVTGRFEASVRIREDDFLERLFQRLVAATLLPGSLPLYVRMMEAFEDPSQSFFIDEIDTSESVAAKYPRRLREGFEIYGYDTDIGNVSLCMRRNDRTFGFLRINFRQSTPLDERLAARLAKACEPLCAAGAELLEWFDGRLTRSGVSRERLQGLRELRRELCERITSSFTAQLVPRRGRANNASTLEYRESIKHEFGLDANEIDELGQLIQSFLGRKQHLEQFSERLQELRESTDDPWFGEITLVSIWASFDAFVVESDDSETLATFFEKEPALVDFLPNLLHLMRSNRVEFECVRLEHPGELAVGAQDLAHAVYVPALARGREVRVKLDGADFEQARTVIRSTRTSDESERDDDLVIDWRYGPSQHLLAVSGVPEVLHRSIVGAVESSPHIERRSGSSQWSPEQVDAGEVRRVVLGNVLRSAPGRSHNLLKWANGFVRFMLGPMWDDAREWHAITTQFGDTSGILLAYGLPDQGSDVSSGACDRSIGALDRLRDESMRSLVRAFDAHLLEQNSARAWAGRRMGHEVGVYANQQVKQLDLIYQNVGGESPVSALLREAGRTANRIAEACNKGVEDDDWVQVDLGKAVNDLVGTWLEWDPEVDLRVEIQDEHRIVHAPKELVREVVRNLITNATHHAKAGRGGGPKLPVVVRTDMGDTEQALRLVVENGGQPRPQEELDHLVEVARAGRRNRTTRPDGHGDGLTIVASHEGRILKRGRREGTLFRMTAIDEEPIVVRVEFQFLRTIGGESQ